MSEHPTGVHCPACGEEYAADFCDGDEALVTYWGDGDPVEVECRRCNTAFVLKEYVMRVWEIDEVLP